MKTATSVIARVFASVIAFGVLFAVLFPVFTQGRSASEHRMGCMSDLKQLGLAAIMYSGDFDDRAPVASTWADLTAPYAHNADIFHCYELHGSKNEFGHAFHSALDRRVLTAFEHPDRRIMFFESVDLAWNANGGLASLPPRPRGTRKNYPFVFVDGHASNLTRKEVARYGITGHR